MDKQKLTFIAIALILLIGLGMWAMKGKDYKGGYGDSNSQVENSGSSYGDNAINPDDVKVEELVEDNLDEALEVLDILEGLE